MGNFQPDRTIISDVFLNSCTCQYIYVDEKCKKKKRKLYTQWVIDQSIFEFQRETTTVSSSNY
jgi:hypothetical protein